MKHGKTFLTAAILTAALAAASSAEGGDEGKGRTWQADLGQPAPAFELSDLEGRAWSLADQKGKVVVLEWFNPDCPYVVRAHAEGGALADLGNRAGSQNVVWVAINSGHAGNPSTGVERNARAKQELGIEYPILLDESGWVGQAYGAKSTPHMFVIDAAGTLVYAGGHDDQQGKNYVAGVLGELAAGTPVSQPRTENYGCGVKYPTKADIGLIAPGFALADLKGEQHALAAHRGKVVVLEWFNPGCPIVQAAHEGGSLAGCAGRAQAAGVVWLAVNSGAPGKQGHGAEQNAAAAERWGMQHPILVDETGTVGKSYGATTTPCMYVIDERGVLVYAGAHDDQQGKNYVDQALAELCAGKPITTPKTRSYGCNVKYAN